MLHKSTRAILLINARKSKNLTRSPVKIRLPILVSAPKRIDPIAAGHPDSLEPSSVCQSCRKRSFLLQPAHQQTISGMKQSQNPTHSGQSFRGRKYAGLPPSPDRDSPQKP